MEREEINRLAGWLEGIAQNTGITFWVAIAGFIVLLAHVIHHW